MRRIIDNDYLTLIVRVVVGGIFVYASIYKIYDPASFAKSIWYYHLLPGSTINLIALTLPWLELLCGMSLFLGYSYRGSVILVNIMTLLFIIALSSAILRDISIDCGCFRAASTANDSALNALWFDIGLIVLTLQLFFSRSRRWLSFYSTNV
jgi:uncharacterized membrane protein YphA (DoxX/SURF4 family)